MIPEEGEHPPIPQTFGLHLKSMVDRHRQALKDRVEDLRASEQSGIERKLRDRADTEAAQVKEMIQTRVNEIRKRLRDLEKKIAQLSGEGPDQMRLSFAANWESEELEQFREDFERLKSRLGQLETERTVQPEQIKKRYKLRALRAFPLGLRFLLPRRTVEKGSL